MRPNTAPQAALVAAALALPAAAQCNTPGIDLVITDITAPANFRAGAGFDGLACGYSLTNFGDSPASVQAATTLHPAVTSGLFAVIHEDGTSSIRQLALSWANHEFVPLSQGGVCTCTPAGASALGPGCTTPTSSGLVANPVANKGPRWQLDPWTGLAVLPHANPPYSQATARRLAPTSADLEDARSHAAAFLVEMQACVPGEPPANRANNASRRAMLPTGPAGDVTFVPFGPTVPGSPAIEAWRDADPAVITVRLEAPEGGLAFAAWTVGEVRPGLWRYRYAVQNVSVTRGFSALFFPDACGRTPEHPLFLAPAYHDGDGIPSNPDDPDRTARDFDHAPWAFAADQSGYGWTLASSDPNANALRWGTLFTFGFDSPFPPRSADARLRYFSPGGPVDLLIRGAPAPAADADFNGDGFTDLFDYADFVRCFTDLACPPGGDADFNHDGFTDFFDYADFLAAFQLGC